jgi:hypothetical protein
VRGKHTKGKQPTGVMFAPPQTRSLQPHPPASAPSAGQVPAGAKHTPHTHSLGRPSDTNDLDQSCVHFGTSHTPSNNTPGYIWGSFLARGHCNEGETQSAVRSLFSPCSSHFPHPARPPCKHCVGWILTLVTPVVTPVVPFPVGWCLCPSMAAGQRTKGRLHLPGVIRPVCGAEAG